MPHSFHEGERAVQERAGVAAVASRVGGSIHAEIPPRAQDFLIEQPFAVLASRDAAGRMWASIVHGAPGFLSAASETAIAIDAAPITGDPLAANLVPGARLGALVVDLATRRRMRVNGRVERAASPIRVVVDEVFANCPKYIQRRDLVVEGVLESRDPFANARDALTVAQQRRIGRADTFFLASGHGDAGLDASHRGGAPGFVEVLGERRIAWPDYTGNSMFQTLGNLASDPRAGLLFADFATGDVLQLSGRARVDWDPGRAARFAGAERVVELEIDAVRETRGALPLRSRAVEPSPFNP
jgi:predicted pyridoxine 5'-phosphate oxidase superfamily flavin-nucleotide-binding protein